MKILTRNNPYFLFVKAYLFGLSFLTLSRIGLLVWQFQPVNETGQILEIIFNGIRVDFIQLGLMFLIPMLLFPINCIGKKSQKVYQLILRFWILISLMILIIIEACTPTFVMEYNTRPNILFIEYLKYPQEVFAMLFKGFFLDIIFVFFSIGVLGRFVYKKFQYSIDSTFNLKHLILWPFMIVLMILSIRSSFGHRPANPAMFAITDNAMVNSLVLNSSYSVFYAAYSTTHESNAAEVYGKLDSSKVYELTGQNGPSEFPTKKLLEPTYKGSPKNIVILLQESLGATFVGSLGGAAVTPNLEELKNEGIWFTQLYATGTRSVRGIEAVVSGFPPTPAQSAVKLPLSQSNFFTLASLLGSKDFETSFIYGGEAHFDNMRNFFTGNGFKTIIEEKNYENPKFKGSWGASDEDLYDKAHQHFLDLSNRNKSFFSLVFTSSNHAPFEFPENTIELYEQPHNTEKNAVKYSDYALGEFIKKAKNSSYWDNTIFLIVADHDIRVRGDHLIPIKNFHIPGLIIGGGIKPKNIDALTSQIDLPVTLLSLAGIKAYHPLIGTDMSSINREYKGRALMQYYDNFAWLEKDKLVVLKPNKEVFFGSYDFKNSEIRPSELAEINYDKQLAYALLPSILYSEKLYKLPPQ